MSNPYRLRSSDLFKRLDDDSKEMPLRIVFLSVEGNATEVDYFKHVEEFRTRLGIKAMVHVEVIRRANSDTKSDPGSVLALLEELVDLHDNGADISKFEGLLPPGYDVEFVREYLGCPECIPSSKAKDFLRKMRGKNLDIAYLKFISRYDSEQDEFCIVVDSDPNSHSVKQLTEISNKCNDKGYHFYISSPCFEFWLLLHLCDVKSEFAGRIDDILNNQVTSNKHSYVSKAVREMAGHSKNISKRVFEEKYLSNVEHAISQSKNFETDVSSLIGSGSIGTNMADLFSLLRK